MTTDLLDTIKKRGTLNHSLSGENRDFERFYLIRPTEIAQLEVATRLLQKAGKRMRRTAEDWRKKVTALEAELKAASDIVAVKVSIDDEGNPQQRNISRKKFYKAPGEA